MGTDAQHVVRLTVAERVQWEGVVADSRAAKSRVLRSRVLLKADADGPAWPDSQIAEAFAVNAITVSRLRKRCVWEGGMRPWSSVRDRVTSLVNGMVRGRPS